jgi:hypothetical protein
MYKLLRRSSVTASIPLTVRVPRAIRREQRKNKGGTLLENTTKLIRRVRVWINIPRCPSFALQYILGLNNGNSIENDYNNNDTDTDDTIRKNDNDI